MTRMRTDGEVYDTRSSTLLMEYVMREPHGVPDLLQAEWTAGIHRLYRRKEDGVYWLHERVNDQKDIAIPLSEATARAGLKDRFGHWRRYARLETQVFRS